MEISLKLLGRLVLLAKATTFSRSRWYCDCDCCPGRRKRGGGVKPPMLRGRPGLLSVPPRDAGVAGGVNVETIEDNLSIHGDLLGVRGERPSLRSNSAALPIIAPSAGSSTSKIVTGISAISGMSGIPSFSRILPVVEVGQFKMELITLTVPSSILPCIPVAGSVIIHEARRRGKSNLKQHSWDSVSFGT